MKFYRYEYQIISLAKAMRTLQQDYFMTRSKDILKRYKEAWDVPAYLSSTHKLIQSSAE